MPEGKGKVGIALQCALHPGSFYDERQSQLLALGESHGTLEQALGACLISRLLRQMSIGQPHRQADMIRCQLGSGRDPGKRLPGGLDIPGGQAGTGQGGRRVNRSACTSPAGRINRGRDIFF